MADVEIFDLPVITAAADTELEGQLVSGGNSGKFTVQDILNLAAQVPWGSIVGTLLQAALDAKTDLSAFSAHTSDADIHYSDAPSDGTQYARINNAWAPVSTVGQISWGDIVGTLSDQTDLQAALDAKANLAGATFTGNVTLDNGQVRINSDNLTALRFRRLTDPGSQGMRFQDAAGDNKFALFLDGNDGERLKLTTYTATGSLSRTVLNFELDTGTLDFGSGDIIGINNLTAANLLGADIFAGTDAGSLALNGATTPTGGANLGLSGASNVTFPYGIRFRRGNTELLTYTDNVDAALRQWSFKDNLVYDVRELRLNGGVGASGLAETTEVAVFAAKQGFRTELWATDNSSNLRVASLRLDGTFRLPGVDPANGNDATRKSYVDGLINALDVRVTALENA
jgi:hypothetical protein